MRVLRFYGLVKDLHLSSASLFWDTVPKLRVSMGMGAGGGTWPMPPPDRMRRFLGRAVAASGIVGVGVFAVVRSYSASPGVSTNMQVDLSYTQIDMRGTVNSQQSTVHTGRDLDRMFRRHNSTLHRIVGVGYPV